MNDFLSSIVESSEWPVCLENACMSLTEPGSVAMILRTCPEVMSVSAFLVLRTGNGHDSPLASSCLLNSTFPAPSNDCRNYRINPRGSHSHLTPTVAHTAASYSNVRL